jgi:hypothetical protein
MHTDLEEGVFFSQLNVISRRLPGHAKQNKVIYQLKQWAFRLIFAFARDVTKTIEELKFARDNIFGKYVCAAQGHFSLLFRLKSSALSACCTGIYTIAVFLKLWSAEWSSRCVLVVLQKR